MKHLLYIAGLLGALVVFAGCGSTDSGSVGAPQETTTEEATTPAEEPTTEEAEPEEAPEYTVAQQNAIASAESYLDFGAFSKRGLIKQLSSKYGEGFSKADARFAVNHVAVNWKHEAAEAAKSYLETSSFSRAGLIQQLESKYGEGFTHAQAVYGVNQTGL